MILFGIKQVGTLMCVRLSDRDPSEVEWKDMIAGLERKLGEFERLVLWSAGGNFNTKRRREIINLVNKGRFKGVLWSDTTAVRGAGTAIGWDTDGAVKGVASLDKAREFLLQMIEANDSMSGLYRQLLSQLEQQSATQEGSGI